MTVFLHRRSAPRRIDDDGVDVCGFEALNHLACEISCLVFEARMNHKRTTARWRLRDDYLTAFGSENTCGGLIDVLEKDLLDTT